MMLDEIKEKVRSPLDLMSFGVFTFRETKAAQHTGEWDKLQGKKVVDMQKYKERFISNQAGVSPSAREHPVVRERPVVREYPVVRDEYQTVERWPPREEMEREMRRERDMGRRRFT